jgi:hypothetical protein
MAAIARFLIVAGLAMAACGVLLWGLALIPGVGRLPGDVYIRRGNFVFYFPLMTSIILSVAITIILSLLRR